MTDAAPESITCEVPREVAFLRPNRVEVWVLIVEMDEPTALEITRETEWSSATIYRILKELEEAGLAQRKSTIRSDTGPTTVFEAVDPNGGVSA